MKLVLSGGGAYGASFVGLIKYLQEHNIKVSQIAGTSMGAVLGSFFAMDMDWHKMQNILVNINNWWIWAVQFWEVSDILDRGGVADSDMVMHELLIPYLPKKWSEFKIDFKVATTNLSKRSIDPFGYNFSTELSPVDAVYSSMAVPLAFRGLRKNGNFYVDGGVVSSMPVELIDQPSMKDTLLAVPTLTKVHPHEPHGFLEIGVALVETMYNDASLSDLTGDFMMIKTGVTKTANFLDFSHVSENVELGYGNAVDFFKTHNLKWLWN